MDEGDTRQQQRLLSEDNNDEEQEGEAHELAPLGKSAKGRSFLAPFHEMSYLRCFDFWRIDQNGDEELAEKEKGKEKATVEGNDDQEKQDNKRKSKRRERERENEGTSLEEEEAAEVEEWSDDEEDISFEKHSSMVLSIIKPVALTMLLVVWAVRVITLPSTQNFT